MVRRGHVPVRMCSGCGGRFAQGDLIRLTARETPAGSVLVLDQRRADGGGRWRARGSGRGGYVCADPDCLGQALASKRLQRRLGASESPELREEFMRLIEARKL